MPKIKEATLSQMRAAQLELTKQNARFRRLQADEKEGKLLPKDELQKQLSLILVAARNKLLSLPSKLSPTLAPIDDPSAIAAVLEKEIHLILSELSNGS